jgi:hypothetical protein
MVHWRLVVVVCVTWGTRAVVVVEIGRVVDSSVDVVVWMVDSAAVTVVTGGCSCCTHPGRQADTRRRNKNKAFPVSIGIRIGLRD